MEDTRNVGTGFEEIVKQETCAVCEAVVMLVMSLLAYYFLVVGIICHGILGIIQQPSWLDWVGWGFAILVAFFVFAIETPALERVLIKVINGVTLKRTVIFLLCLVIAIGAGLEWKKQRDFERGEAEIVVMLNGFNADWEEIIAILERIKNEFEEKESYTRAEYEPAYNRYERELTTKLGDLLGKGLFGLIETEEGERDWVYRYIFLDFYPKHEVELGAGYPSDILEAEGVSGKVKKAVRREIELGKRWEVKMEELKRIEERSIID